MSRQIDDIGKKRPKHLVEQGIIVIALIVLVILVIVLVLVKIEVVALEVVVVIEVVISKQTKVKKECYLIRQGNTIYK